MGPYKNGSIEWTKRNHSFSNKHPNPFDEKGALNKFANSNPKNFKEYICGFESIHQLKQWFTKKEINNLKALGFIIVSYEAKDIKKGQYQVMFKPKGKRKILKTY